MQKKRIRRLVTNRVLLKFWKIMRLGVFISLLFVAQVFATATYSQQTRLTLKMQGVKVIDVLSKIEDESEFFFLFNQKLLDVDRQVNVDVKNESIANILSGIFEKTNVSFLVKDRQIILTTDNSATLTEQERKISGKVTDQSGQPIPGASVVVKGTTTGVITGGDGSFSLTIPSDAKTLAFSFVGMKTLEVALGNQTTINIKLTEETIGLEEVVAIGYGTQRKKDLTGAVAHLDITKQETLPNTNAMQSLRGTIAGVNVNDNGRPGSVGNLSIRGITSLSAGTSPLIIVDGIPLAGSLSDVDPADIETIDVLKDGSSAAVYGAKSANGVILITTKKGKSDKPVINYNGYYGFQDYSKKLKTLDGSRYMQKITDYRKAVGEVNPDPVKYLQELELINYNAGKTMNPVDYVTQSAPMYSSDLSVSGKNNRTTYYLGGSYTDQKGLVFNDNFKRASLRVNLENKITDWFAVGLNSSFSNRDMSGKEGDMNLALQDSPYSQMEDDMGNLLQKVHGVGEATLQNPKFLAARTVDKEVQQYLTGNIYAQIDIPQVKGLSYRINYSNTFNWYKHYIYTPAYTEQKQNDVAVGSKQHNYSYNWLLENIVKYQKRFGEIHNIDATLLFSRDHFDGETSLLGNSVFASDALGYNALQLGGFPTASSSASESNGISYMARLNYQLKSRYILSLLVRRDGFSAFGKDRKYGTFPSVSAGWTMTEESFMKGFKFLNNLKLRASYSENGNQAISPYASLASMAQSYYVFGDGSKTYNGLQNGGMGNDNLTWETTKSSNFGLDFAVLNNRLSGSLEYYIANTENLLMRRSIPIMTGYTSVMTNLGNVNNKGFEVTLNSVNIKTPKFEWTSFLTFSTNKNKITHLYGQDMNKDGKEDDDIANNWFIGYPLGAIYDYRTNGVYQVGETITDARFKPGYFRIVDINNDGVLNTSDRSVIGKTTPDARIGLGNTLIYGDFSLYVFLNSAIGGMKNVSFLNPSNNFPEKTNFIDVKGDPYWTPENRSNTRPIVSYPMPFKHGIYRNLDYVRIQDVSLTYTIPKKFLTKAKIENLKIYASAKNLYTFTKWPGWDPESDDIGLGSTVGIGGFPMARQFILGINFSF